MDSVSIVAEHKWEQVHDSALYLGLKHCHIARESIIWYLK
jgi:hypothetical protein